MTDEQEMKVEPLLYSVKQLSAAINLTRTSIYSLIKKGAFPTPIKVGKRSLWARKEVEQWINKRVLEKELKLDQDQEIDNNQEAINAEKI